MPRKKSSEKDRLCKLSMSLC